MLRQINICDQAAAKQVLAVQIPAYKIEADIIGFDEIPPLRDTVETLMQCGETFYGYYIEDELAGAISYKVEGDIVDIHRMMVDPKHFRKGVATSLLRFVEEIEQNAKTLIVATGALNEPAKNLYVRLGFTELRDVEVADQVFITQFEKVR